MYLHFKELSTDCNVGSKLIFIIFLKQKNLVYLLPTTCNVNIQPDKKNVCGNKFKLYNNEINDSKKPNCEFRIKSIYFK